MKKLKLENEVFKLFVANYKEWLDILGYAESTVYYLPNHLQEFFFYLEQQQVFKLSQITSKIIKNYYQELKERANQRTSGSLSKSYLNKHQQALKKFNDYLKQHKSSYVLSIHLKTETHLVEEKLNILTQDEIKLLFKTTDYSHKKSHFRLRDKAILSVLYSCGLRRNEAVHLNLSDVLFDKARIYVRKGKNYKERFVPINHKNTTILEDYIYESRPYFNIKQDTEALFLNHHGTRMQGQSFSTRLQAIIKASNLLETSEKHVTLHILRHSIATHLLQQNVPLESIKTFLGHSSLESTQIYTHLLETLNNDG